MHSVSIIIAHYNRPGLLKRAIKSAIKQSVEPLEIIVVDDSSDPEIRGNLRNICERLDARLVQRMDNGGPSASRNDGIRSSKGEWIQLLDSDDLLPFRSLESRLMYINANPGVKWVAGQMAKVSWYNPLQLLEPELLDKLRFINPKPEPLIRPVDVAEDSLFKVRWHHCAILYHRSLFEKFGLYDEFLWSGEDKELRWRFWHFSRTYPGEVKEVVYLYRQGLWDRIVNKKYDSQRKEVHNRLLDRIRTRTLEGLNRANTTFLER